MHGHEKAKILKTKERAVEIQEKILERQANDREITDAVLDFKLYVQDNRFFLLLANGNIQSIELSAMTVGALQSVIDSCNETLKHLGQIH